LLLIATDCLPHPQVRNLELLKKRFGETALSQCEVMLKDIAESKRNTRAIQQHFDDGSARVLDATIVSRLCWPALTNETFELPAALVSEMARYEKQYAHGP
jgi:anaphase-promoting complex subunit 2